PVVITPKVQGIVSFGKNPKLLMNPN
ncbi:MAG: hypothetical protein QOJ99_5009, partial [Bryobacterales bacterium]|nr:hypothetical protein [Bryobacterales bacterium]